ncbi:MAG: hypothetical protein KDD61_15730, partial [Bdellovibrionales bacterium]|nr:hypothetical protein [Bdellovibrionales bacterium]
VEISKIEAYLGRMVHASPERERYEGQLKQLLDQRLSLTQMIEENKKGLLEKIKRIKNMANIDVLIPTPPPPPSMLD